MSFGTHDWDIWSEPDCIRVQIEHEYHANGDMTISNVAPRERILASEQVWRLPSEWNEISTWCRPVERSRIVTRNDIFAPFSGKWVGKRGERLGLNEHGEICVDRTSHHQRVETADVIARYFATVDACPNCEFVAVTDRPERVREVWVNGFGVKNPSHAHRPNLSLAVRVRTQPEASERIPAAMALCDLVGKVYVWAEPSEEIVLPFVEEDRGGNWRAETKFGGMERPDGVVICNLPHTDFYPLIDQCEAAGVDCWIEEPKSTHTAKYTDPSEKLSPTAQNYLRQLREGAE